MASGPFTNMVITNIPAWMSNHMSSKGWYEITYPYPNFNGCTVEVWDWINDFLPYILMGVIHAGIELNNVRKSNPPPPTLTARGHHSEGVPG